LTTYADASFLTSLYVLDPNSKLAVETLRQHSPQLVISEFGVIETLNAFYQRCFRGQLDTLEANKLADSFQKDISSGFLLLRTVPEEAYTRSRAITLQRTPQLGTRTGDVLHVATALEYAAEWFLSFDKRQLRLAVAEGLKTF
jgi:predicted nucleic acid-binding protein